MFPLAVSIKTEESLRSVTGEVDDRTACLTLIVRELCSTYVGGPQSRDPHVRTFLCKGVALTSTPTLDVSDFRKIHGGFWSTERLILQFFGVARECVLTPPAQQQAKNVATWLEIHKQRAETR